ncbi:MAG: NfeD family protein [Acidobacteria bacterium]|nr:NfeD family protein [Acidobacteriota bacterium]
MNWWIWLGAGVVLMVVELATPSGFFIMFFGLGAVTVGLLGWLGVVTGAIGQWLLFPVASLAYLLLFRGQVQRRFETPPPPNVDSFVGVLAVPQERIEPGAVGRVEVRGSAWNARNIAAAALSAGQRCIVVSVDGLLLTVRPE